MPYLGNHPTANFATVTKDTFNGNASSYTLSKPATTNGVAVYVENVRQIPTTAYSVSGTTLTFTGTTPAGTNNVYVLHHNTPVSTATHPSAQDLTAANATMTGTLSVTGATTVGGTSNLTIADGDLVIGTGGHGIDFSAQTAASGQSASATGELFDRYEEGIFTHGGNANMTINSVSARGFYQIIGNRCFVNGFVRFTHSGTNNVYISLPIASKADITSPANGEQESATVCWFPTHSTGLQQLATAYVGSNSSTIFFYKLGSSSGLFNNNDLDSTAEVYYNLSYLIA